jgi:hypothetical protein
MADISKDELRKEITGESWDLGKRPWLLAGYPRLPLSVSEGLAAGAGQRDRGIEG